MTIKRLAVGLALLALSAALAILFADEAVDPELLAWIERSPTSVPPEQNGGFYLMGLDAPSGEDPMVYALTTIKPQLAKYHPLTEVPANKPPHPSGKPPLSTAGIDSRYADDFIDQLNDWLTQPVKLAAYVEAHQEHINRFEELMDLPAVLLNQHENYTADWPSFPHIESASAMMLANATHLYHHSPQGAAEYLTTRITDMRRHSTTTNSLIFEVALLTSLKRSYQLLVTLGKHSEEFQNTILQKSQIFRLQSVAERSMRRAFRRNAIQAEITFRSLAEGHVEQQGHWWWRSLVYKPNETFNIEGRFWLKQANASELPADRLFNLRAISANYEANYWNIGNIVGEIMASVARPCYVDLSKAFCQLDWDIQLCQLALTLQASGEDILDITQEMDVHNHTDGSLPYTKDDQLCMGHHNEAGDVEHEVCITL